MIYTWDQVLPEIMEQLTPHEQNALSLEQDKLRKPSSNIGETRLKSFGFATIDDYKATLRHAKLVVREYMSRVYDVRHVNDLGFTEGASSSEGRINRNTKLVFPTPEEEEVIQPVRIMYKSAV